MTALPPKLSILPMRLEYLTEVLAIETKAYDGRGWSREALCAELNKDYANYWVALNPAQEVLGYCGGWLLLDEFHITNIAVRALDRRRGVATQLMNKMIKHAASESCSSLTLEVRVSNYAAIELYNTIGFSRCGQRKGYYAVGCSSEDGLIMTKYLV